MSAQPGNQTMGRQPELMNLARAQALMAEAGIDALVATSGRNLYYASDYPCFDYMIEAEMLAYAVVPRQHSEDGFLVIPASDRFVLQDYPSWLRNKIFVGNYYVKNAPELSPLRAPSATAGFVHAVQELGLAVGRLGLELDLLPANVLAEIRRVLPEATLVNGSPLFERLRMIKGPEEVARLRRSAMAIDRGVRAGLEMARPGMTERELEGIIHQGTVSEGATILYLQVGAAGRGAYGTMYSGDVPIKRGDVVRVDAAGIH